MMRFFCVSYAHGWLIVTRSQSEEVPEESEALVAYTPYYCSKKATKPIID